jgi:two-component system CheB/CheR fusion protein
MPQTCIKHPTYIVGIGGSAGALNAYKALLDHLSADTGMAFVFISHMNPEAYSQLALILARHTKMPALIASADMPISVNHVYVIPANADLGVEKYKFKVISPRSRRNVQIDLFFTSIAEDFGDRAIGVVFSGYDGDGTAGCKHIKEKGGITFAQDQSAEVDSMPLSAHASGYVDFVLAPDKISAVLIEIGARFARSILASHTTANDVQ